jgi:alginate O-acetyltransferase complex protein AlgI
MLFNSFEFALFFPIVTILFFLLPHRYRWLLLLLASCFFYMFFKPVYIFILIFTILIDYFAAILIARQVEKKKRKLLLLISIIANVGILVVFKYYNFLATNLQIVMESVHKTGHIPLLNMLLPIGLSFHTFQAMSYTIEVYRGKQVPEKHLGIYALYVMFYPQLVAGPIERPQNILHQFHEPKSFNYENMRSGLILMAWGLFKKVVIADRLALFVNHVYGQPLQYKGLPLIISSVFFAFQIYCDFSGYSDIAIGSARCMGYELMQNFNKPYMSTSISEFWQRWHISLSTWFRDYVYIPLGGNRLGAARWCLNIMIVFLISGIWHGANWTFLIWGLLNGVYLLIEHFLKKLVPQETRKPNTNNMLLTMFHRIKVFLLITLAWVFFRAENLSQALYIIKHMFVGLPEQIRQIFYNENFARLKLLYLHNKPGSFVIALLLLALLMTVHHRQKTKEFSEWLTAKPTYVRWTAYYVLVLSFVTLGVFNNSEFIYFKF